MQPNTEHALATFTTTECTADARTKESGNFICMYCFIARLLHKNIVLHMTNNKQQVINNENEIIARFLEFHVSNINFAWPLKTCGSHQCKFHPIFSHKNVYINLPFFQQQPPIEHSPI